MSVLHTKLRRDLMRRRAQVGAVLVTIVLGVALFGASFDAYANLEASYQRTYERLSFADLTVTGGNSAAIATDAEGVQGTAAVTRRTQADAPFRVGDNRLYGRVVGMPAADQPSVDALDVTAGTYLDRSVPNGVIAEQHLADHFGLHPGDTVEVALDSGWQQVTILGTAVSPEYLWPASSRQQVFTTADDFGVLFVPEALAARAGSSVAVSQVLVRYEEGADTSSLDATLSASARRAGATDVMTRADQPSNAALQEDVSGFGELSFMFPLLFLGAAGMATFMLLTRLVHAQRAQIGTLEANGLSRGTVLRHYLSFGLLTGLVGSVIGVALGIPLGRLITGTYTSSLSIPDTVVAFHPLTPLLGIVFGVLAGLLAAWAPARRALKVQPAEAMRGDTPTAAGRASLLERLVPPLRRAPVRWRMAMRGIGRNWRRSISTIIGVVLALVLVLASWGMVDTTQVLLDRQFNQIDQQDAQIFFTQPLTATSIPSVAGVAGVARAEQVAQLPAAITHHDQSYATDLTAFGPDTEMHTFRAPDGHAIALPESGVLLGDALRSTIGVAAGDTVTVSLPTLHTSFTTTVAGFVSEPLGSPAYVATPELEALLAEAQPAVAADTLRLPGVGSVMARYGADANPATTRSSLSDLPDIAVVVDSGAIYDTVQSLLGFFYAFVGVMLLFGGVMAFALIFNMMSVNIAERSAELATMRANGFDLGTIARLLTAENVLLTSIGIAVGIPIGVWTAAVFLGSFSSDLFQFDLQVRASTLIISGLTMIAVTLLSQLPGIRTVGRLDLGAVIRERSQ